MLLSNTSLNSVRDCVRSNALQSFVYFANSVLGLNLNEELCSTVQDLLEDQENTFVVTRSPRALSIAVHQWLDSKGVKVLSTTPIPRHEVLDWLSLEKDSMSEDLGVALTIRNGGLSIEWI